MKRHWTEYYTCSCGFRTTDYYTDAKHRHNWPALCRKKKSSSRKKAVDTMSTSCQNSIIER